jgi:Arc/MetJ-type ribon-helix-helix transcriptional regulator
VLARYAFPVPNTRAKIETKIEQVRFTKGQLRDLDALVKSERYGTSRGDVIRFFVMQGLAEFDKRGRLSDDKQS